LTKVPGTIGLFADSEREITTYNLIVLSQFWLLLRDRVRRMRSSTVNELRFRSRHPDATISDGVLLQGADRIRAGRKLFLDRRCYLNVGTLNDRAGFIEMGDNVEIGPYSVLWGAGGISIGNNVHIGAHVAITAHESLHIDPAREEVFAPLDFEYAPVVIEDHVLVCSGTQIIPGVRIGHHAMIGAGAVVISDIPPYALAVGCPARVIRYSNAAALTALAAVEQDAIAV
jgi:acetyltransferase-like isoleucine patch superfamily enzyme